MNRPADPAASHSAAVPNPGSLRPPPPAAPGVEVPIDRAPVDPGQVGDPRVEDALSRLAELDGMPLAEQVAVFADIHRRLEAVLADPDARG